VGIVVWFGVEREFKLIGSKSFLTADYRFADTNLTDNRSELNLTSEQI
jgi:hypothetical protein